jgi:hypothetical protein
VLDHSNFGIPGSNPALVVDVGLCLRLCVVSLFCVSNGRPRSLQASKFQN